MIFKLPVHSLSLVLMFAASLAMPVQMSQPGASEINRKFSQVWITGADFSATYYLLPGLNYMSAAKIRVPSKNMVISLKFYDFEKRR